MYVYKIVGKDAKNRNRVWCARDRADGVKKLYKTEKAARNFAEEYNLNKNRRSFNIPLSNKALKKWSVQGLIMTYMDRGLSDDNFEDRVYDEDNKEELIERCELQPNLASVLWNFAFQQICKKSLFDFTPQVAEKYVRDMANGITYVSHGSEIEKEYRPSTIRRNVTAIQKAWTWARTNKDSLSNLENPWKEIPWKQIFPQGTNYKRQRGLKPGESEKLEKACEKCRGSNRYYILLAINIAVDTGMRRQEMFNLVWDDIDLEARTINIRASKTDWKTGNEGRKICLPPLSCFLLAQLGVSLRIDGCTPGRERFEIPKEHIHSKGPIFIGAMGEAMTGNGFKQVFEEVRDRAGIVDVDRRRRLTPHSLRAAAEMLFRKAGLTDKEIDVMQNGIKGNYDVLDDFLEIIHKKLDIAFFEKPGKPGKPLSEVEKEIEAKYPSLQERQARLEAMHASLQERQARLAEEVV